jgi:hypothetical protein
MLSLPAPSYNVLAFLWCPLRLEPATGWQAHSTLYYRLDPYACDYPSVLKVKLEVIAVKVNLLERFCKICQAY